MSRKISREKMMHLLYQMELHHDYSEKQLEEFIEEVQLKPDEIQYLKQHIPNCVEKRDEIDAIIQNHLVDWKIDRISKVDISILRVALYEIEYCEEIPIEVSINEAVELAKKYSDVDSNKFINGLLGQFVRSNKKS